MQDEKEEGREKTERHDDVKIPVPWSQAPLTLPGKLLAGSILTIAGFFCLAWMIRDSDMRQIAQIQRASEDRQEQMREMIKTQKDIKKSMDAMVFLVSKPESERRKYHLDTPELLRFQIVERRDE